MSRQPDDCSCTDEDICDSCAWEMVASGVWAESLTLEDWDSIADLEYEWDEDVETD